MNVAVPEDREFRNAWTFTGKKLKVDMKLARELHIGRIRQKRNEALTELDKETMAAIADKEELAKVEKRNKPFVILWTKLNRCAMPLKQSTNFEPSFWMMV